MTTRAPSATNRSAMARPMPRLPPLMTASLPASWPSPPSVPSAMAILLGLEAENAGRVGLGDKLGSRRVDGLVERLHGLRRGHVEGQVGAHVDVLRPHP